MMKYAALILNGVAVLLLGWTVYGVVQLAQARTPTVRGPVMELMPLVPALRTDQARVLQAFGAMERVQLQASGPDPQPQPLITLPAPGRPIEGSVQMPARSLSLHLDNLGAETQMVVIDGHLVRQGAQLEQGGRVKQVQPHEVLVTEQLGRQTLALPLSELRVGTLRWPDGSLASVATQEFKAGVAGTAPGPLPGLLKVRP